MATSGARTSRPAFLTRKRRAERAVERWSLAAGGQASERPRHAEREAGLVITSDLCPAMPGSWTRLSTSLQKNCVCMRLGQSLVSLSSSTIQAVPSLDGEG